MRQQKDFNKSNPPLGEETKRDDRTLLALLVLRGENAKTILVTLASSFVQPSVISHQSSVISHQSPVIITAAIRQSSSRRRYVVRRQLDGHRLPLQIDAVPESAVHLHHPRVVVSRRRRGGNVLLLPPHLLHQQRGILHQLEKPGVRVVPSKIALV